MRPADSWSVGPPCPDEREGTVVRRFLGCDAMVIPHQLCILLHPEIW
jgi:hypothetical protein